MKRSIGSARLIRRRLARAYPDAACGLRFRGRFQLLTAVILSAQTTDTSVNRVTPGLFARYPDAAALARAPLPAVRRILKPLGLYRNKAAHIVAAAQRLVDQYGGRVPGTRAELTTFPGVGRKTANVVLGEGFGIPGITVDTHVARVSARLGLTRQVDPLKVESDLNRVVPARERTVFSHRLIAHGRQVCRARNPRCGECPLNDLCPWPDKERYCSPSGNERGVIRFSP